MIEKIMTISSINTPKELNIKYEELVKKINELIDVVNESINPYQNT